MADRSDPVFKVTITATEPATRLVRAKGPRAAYDHVVRDLVNVVRATPDDIVEVARGGAGIEEASE